MGRQVFVRILTLGVTGHGNLKYKLTPKPSKVISYEVLVLKMQKPKMKTQALFPDFSCYFNIFSALSVYQCISKTVENHISKSSLNNVDL